MLWIRTLASTSHVWRDDFSFCLLWISKFAFALRVYTNNIFFFSITTSPLCVYRWFWVYLQCLCSSVNFSLSLFCFLLPPSLLFLSVAPSLAPFFLPYLFLWLSFSLSFSVYSYLSVFVAMHRKNAYTHKHTHDHKTHTRTHNTRTNVNKFATSLSTPTRAYTKQTS